MQKENEKLEIQAIEKQQKQTLTIRLAISSEASKDKIEEQAKELYEEHLEEIERPYQDLLKGQRLDACRSEFQKHHQGNHALLSIIKTMADKESVYKWLWCVNILADRSLL